MSGVMMMIIAIVVLGGAYLLLRAIIQNKWGHFDPNAKTPAYEMEDGVDYVPADKLLCLVISSRRSPVQVDHWSDSRRQFLAGFQSCFEF